MKRKVALDNNKLTVTEIKYFSAYFFYFLFFTFYSSTVASSQIVTKRVATLMGSRFDFTVVTPNDSLGNIYIDTVIAEIGRIENVISEWRPNTLVSEINRNAGLRPIKVTKELFDLTRHAIYFSKMTNGAFDISIAALDKIWQFDGSMTEMPTPDAVKKCVEKVSWQNIVLDSTDTTIYLRLPGMKIGFGSIGKGYAADKGRTLLQSLGVKAGIVNASGDMSAWGRQPNGKEWNIGLTNPFKPEKLLTTIPLDNGSVTTSGSYEKFVVFNGKRYSHIINPSTGYPATGLISVTVKGPKAETANGLSTSIMVLGKNAGLELMGYFPDYSCILIADNGKRNYTPTFKHHIQ